MTDQSTESTIPWPPRYRWLKRGIGTGVIVLIALAVLRWQWGLAADRRIKRFVDEAHARGELGAAEDFATPAVPDSENAAISLQRAANAIKSDAQFTKLEDARTYPWLTPYEIATFAVVKARNADVLALCRRVRLQPRADWNIPANAPMALPRLNYFNAQRWLANFLRYTAEYDHQTGDSSGFVEACRDLLRQEQIVNESFPIVTSWIVGSGIDAMAMDQIDQAAVDLQIEGPWPLGVSARNFAPASPQQMRDLIADLLHERRLLDDIVRDWEGERASDLQLAELISRGGWVQIPQIPASKLWIVRPMIQLDGLRLAERDSKMLASVTLRNWIAASSGLPPAPGSVSHLEDVSQMSSRRVHLSGGVMLRQQFTTIANRRAAAIQLAIRLYRAEHAGKLPASLQELVPSDLPYVPEDPFAATGTPMHYRPELNPPIIYSVSFDGFDNQGAVTPGAYRWSCPDAVWIVGPTAPATQPQAVPSLWSFP